MAGHDLVTEGFAPGQVGSSAMPHKMNTRSCERVNGLQVVLRGYASMAAELAGAQWNEGDVFCSVVRRVALPDAFFAIDGQTETFLTVLDEFGAYPAVIQRELDRYLPFLATTASATPFIGLFGTVWGIMSAFHGIGAQGSASLAVVAPGISEALVATAAGLAAAIPAVIGYNYFVNRVRHWATEMDGFMLDLLNVLARPVPKLARPSKDGV
jgi:hypothetical protein